MAESVKFTDIAATTAGFSLLGGTYQIVLQGTDVNSVGLEVQNAVGQWVAQQAAWTAAGVFNVDLAGGTYRFALASASGVNLTLSKIRNRF